MARRCAFLALFSVFFTGSVFATATDVGNFINFETAPVHPVALSPNRRTLAICNLPDNRVELFDVSSGVPAPIDNVFVGLDPVTVRFATSNELWVVNHISSSISIVDLSTLTVVTTIDTPAGPSDVVFAGNPRRAWVSCTRTNAVFVIDPATRTAVATLTIDAERPRSMAASPDGSKVYVAIFESGNGTTVIGPALTPPSVRPAPGPVEDPNGPHGGLSPPPNFPSGFSPRKNTSYTNEAPRVSHIVRKTASGRWIDDSFRDWTEWVSGTNAAASGRISGWDLPDRDVAIIDTSTLQIDYARRLMNICMAIAVNPVSGEIAVVGTDAINEIRFEPILNGVFLRVNLALVDPFTRTSRIRDLNPHLDYIERTFPLEERAPSIGDPRGIEWSSDGQRAFITGMGSRNLIIVNANGNRIHSNPIELLEGPTGIAVDDPRNRLYVWNRFSSAISVVDIQAGMVITNVPVFDPTPDIIQKGRRHLYDTRKTSGLGIASCASCHVDAKTDRLAWDLGNPAGELVTNANFVFHPMKGPMLTQTLQDIITPTNFNGMTLPQQPLHWRGDRKGIEEFNQTFTNLQASDVVLTTNEMTELKAMLASIFFPPNFLRTFSNSLPTSVSLPGHFGHPAGNGARHPLPPGNARAGFSRFVGSECRLCHDFNQGRNLVIDELLDFARNGTQGAFKSPQFRSLAERVGMDGLSTNSRAGFGFMHDGRVDTLTRFLIDGFPEFVSSDQSIADIIAFLLCFSGSDFTSNPSNPSQDVPAATGRQLTFSSSPPSLLRDMFDLAARTNSRVELILRGKKDGTRRGWLLRRATRDFQSDRHSETMPNLDSLIALAAPGNEFTATMVPEGSGMRLALDRDSDGFFDTSEIEMGFNPSDPRSHPARIIALSKSPDGFTLWWQSAPGTVYAVEYSTNLATNTWTTIGSSLSATSNITTYTDSTVSPGPVRFYRIRF